MFRQLVLGVAVSACVAGPAAAQATVGQFVVGPRIGYAKYDTDAGLKEAGVLGIDAVYHVSRNLAIGFTVDVGRPATDSSFFPAEMSFGDTTFIFAVSQPVTVVNYHLQAKVTTGGSLAPFLVGSVGGYQVTADPQVAAGESNFRELGFSFGAGVDLSTGSSTSIRLEVRDFVWSDFDREFLYPVRQSQRPSRFPDVLPQPDPFRGTAHNIVASLAFSFTPGGSQ